MFEPCGNALDRATAEGNESDLAALAADAKTAFGDGKIMQRQIGEFGDAQAGGVEEFEDGGIADGLGAVALRSVEQAFDFVLAEAVGEETRETGSVEVLGRVVARDFFVEQEGMETANGTEVAKGGACVEPVFVQGGKIGEDILARDLGGVVDIVRGEPAEVAGQIATVGGDGAFRKAVLEDGEFEEAVKVGLERR